MAPRKRSNKLPTAAKSPAAVNAKIAKPKPKPKPKCKRGKVRRQENGLFDVERKGRYLKPIKANAQSPLLRLPAEIRNQIYVYALDGRTIKMKPDGHKREPNERGPNSLLRVCRQIYAETALLPYSLNTLATETMWDVLMDGDRLGNYAQKDAITTLRMPLLDARETLDSRGLTVLLFWLTRWPSLVHVQFDILKDQDRDFRSYGGIDGYQSAVLEPRQRNIEARVQNLQQKGKLKEDVKVTFHRHDGLYPSPLYQFL